MLSRVQQRIENALQRIFNHQCSRHDCGVERRSLQGFLQLMYFSYACRVDGKKT